MAAERERERAAIQRKSLRERQRGGDREIVAVVVVFAPSFIGLASFFPLILPFNCFLIISFACACMCMCVCMFKSV